MPILYHSKALEIHGVHLFCCDFFISLLAVFHHINKVGLGITKKLVLQIQTCQLKIWNTESLWIFLLKKPEDFSPNREMSKSGKKIGRHAISVIVQFVNWYF